MVSAKSLANLRPNIFSKTNQPLKKRGPSPVTELKKLLSKKISYEDSETKKMVKGPIARVIALREIYNACEGDQNAIEDIMDRVDGKVTEKVEQSIEGNIVINIIRPQDS